MLVEVTNLTASTLNYFDYYLGYPGVPAVTSAVGGNRVNQLPYPFDWVTLAPNGSSGYQSTMPMNERDWRRKAVPSEPMEPGEMWNQLVQAGTVSLTLSAETSTNRDSENLFIHAL